MHFHAHITAYKYSIIHTHTLSANHDDVATICTRINTSEDYAHIKIHCNIMYIINYIHKYTAVSCTYKNTWQHSAPI